MKLPGISSTDKTVPVITMAISARISAGPQSTHEQARHGALDPTNAMPDTSNAQTAEKTDRRIDHHHHALELSPESACLYDHLRSPFGRGRID
jgi:hypothetical protein